MANLELGERFLLPVLMRLRQEKETSTTERISRERIRPLWVYILDPAEMGLRHGGTLLSVPWEPLKPGPHGRRFKVDPTVSLSMLKMLDWSERRSLSQLAKPLNLNDPALAAAGGLPPTTGDPQFAAQMTYAVCENVFQTFRQALGREPTFGPWLKRSIDAGGRTELLIEPYAFEEDNAYYEPKSGALQFGFFKVENTDGLLAGRGTVQQYALSHDIICHELAHALLDGMRAHFMIDSNPDVAAFHEGFADLIALLHHFTCRPLVQQAIEETGGIGVRALLDLGRQLGESDTPTGGSAMRSAMNALVALAQPNGPADPAWDEFDRLDTSAQLDASYRLTDTGPFECHDRGAVLVAAVMEAFLVTFRKRVRPFRRLARIMRPTDTEGLPAELINLLTREVSKLAEQFLRMVIRAIDYCPPVDIHFGEYLRAMITIDRELMPHDEYDYRGALIRAFRRRGISLGNVLDFSESSVCWSAPMQPLAPIRALAFSSLRLSDDGSTAAGEPEMRRWGQVFAQYLDQSSDHLSAFGLCPARGAYDPPVLESLNVFHRIGGERSVSRGLIAEVSQTRRSGSRVFVGGCTIVIDEQGAVRYAIRKRVDSLSRRKQQSEYRSRSAGKPLDLSELHARARRF
ncbi:MAG: hypothetical protein KA778_05355 [Burkholderiaceae bacterium]|nr:hypothetical protein [Burkholderiaceae bacterium]